jgi:hypothetical protein
MTKGSGRNTPPTSSSPGWFGRNAVTWGAVGLAVAAVIACSEDRTFEAGKTMAGPQEISKITALSGEYNAVDNATINVNGATWNKSGAFKVGSGLLNPFLSIQNDGHEEGFNTDGTLPLDSKRTNFTNALPLNIVPVVRRSGVPFREFIFDANEANSVPDALFSIDRFNLWLCNDSTANLFDDRTDFESNSKCRKVYDIGGTDRILATDDVSSGSGNGYDYQILIPDQKFDSVANLLGVSTTADCSYNPSIVSCGSYLILDTKMGFKADANAVGSNPDYATGATFEEFSTLKRPWVKVTKTAVPSFTRRYKWLINKSVTPTDLTLFDAQTDSASWSINVTPGSPAFTDSLRVVTGTITLENTSGGVDSVLSIADSIPGYPAVQVTCPNGTTNIVLADKSSYVCTYTVAAPDANPGAHTNTATVDLRASEPGEDPSVFKGTAQFNFANATPTEIDKNPPVFDNYNGGGESQIGTATGTTWPFVYKKGYTCGSSQDYSNVARVDITTGTDPTATATFHLHCLGLTVTKTAGVSLRRRYLWTIDKAVTPTSWNLFDGDKGTSQYTITVTPNGSIDSTQVAAGNITVHNPNSVPVYIQTVADTISTGLVAAVGTCQVSAADVSLPYTLAAGADLICPYTRSLPDNTVRTNKATATAKPTATGQNKAFTGTASVDPSTATVTEINKTVNVTDKYRSLTAAALGTAGQGAPTVFSPTRTFSCPDSAGSSHQNIATITETGQADTANVAVTCNTVSVTKTATASFKRAWNWGVDKSINPNDLNLLLVKNQSYIAAYTVTYTSSAPIDSAMQVTGGIAITNNASGISATIDSVTDLITAGNYRPTPSCGVTFPYTLTAGSTLNCTYTQVLPDKTTRSNTATATRHAYSYTSALVQSSNTPSFKNYASTATAITFGTTPASALDECVNVDDSQPSGAIVTGKICAGDPPASKTFTYNHTFDTSVCGPYQLQNVAVFTTTAGTSATVNSQTPKTGQDTVTVGVNVTCPVVGCTLTQGYWKTHNLSFKGGAAKKADDTWNILPQAELTGFFTTDATHTYPVVGPNTAPFTWFGVFWTAPQGNPYYNLAHQYEAAKLNVLNGADPTVVTTAIGLTETFLAQYGPLTPWTKQQKQTMTQWAGLFGDYNEGKVGPGHCDEDLSSVQ